MCLVRRVLLLYDQGHKRWCLFPPTPGLEKPHLKPKGIGLDGEAVTWFHVMYPRTKMADWTWPKPMAGSRRHSWHVHPITKHHRLNEPPLNIKQPAFPHPISHFPFPISTLPFPWGAFSRSVRPRIQRSFFDFFQGFLNLSTSATAIDRFGDGEGNVKKKNTR